MTRTRPAGHYRRFLVARWRRVSGEAGSVTGWVLILIPAMWLAIGLAFDGGRWLTTRRDAIGVADQAARAAVDRLDQYAYRDGTGGANAVAPGAAQAGACGWVATHRPDATCTARTSRDGVTVTVTITYRPVILSAVGLTELTARGTSTARAAIGDTSEIPAP